MKFLNIGVETKRLGEDRRWKDVPPKAEMRIARPSGTVFSVDFTDPDELLNLAEQAIAAARRLRGEIG